MRVLVCKERRVSRAARLSKLRTTSARKSRKSDRLKSLVEVSSKTEVSMGMGEGERKQGGRDGAGGMSARGFCGDALTSVSVWSLPAPTSDRHALRHLAHCRSSARGNLHRDLDLAAERPAVLAHSQSSEY
eukprot:5576068-Pleurochrysis_carterae.AAC.2